MRHLFVVAAIVLGANDFASAAGPSCEAQVTDKKLSLAARANFIHKCQADAKEAASKVCAIQAEDQKLAGSAKTRFVKKCVKAATTGERPVNAYSGIG